MRRRGRTPILTPRTRLAFRRGRSRSARLVAARSARRPSSSERSHSGKGCERLGPNRSSAAPREDRARALSSHTRVGRRESAPTRSFPTQAPSSAPLWPSAPRSPAAAHAAAARATCPERLYRRCSLTRCDSRTRTGRWSNATTSGNRLIDHQCACPVRLEELIEHIADNRGTCAEHRFPEKSALARRNRNMRLTGFPVRCER